MKVYAVYRELSEYEDPIQYGFYATRELAEETVLSVDNYDCDRFYITEIEILDKAIDIPAKDGWNPKNKKETHILARLT